MYKTSSTGWKVGGSTQIKSSGTKHKDSSKTVRKSKARKKPAWSLSSASKKGNLQLIVVPDDGDNAPFNYKVPDDPSWNRAARERGQWSSRTDHERGTST